MASLFHYLRWLAPAFVRLRQRRSPCGPPDSPSKATAYDAGLLALTLGLASGTGFELLTGHLARR